MSTATSVKKRIYIVDDEPKLGEMFATVLQRDGFEAHSFLDPEAVLERVDRDEVPDVVLADLKMPGMSGVELIGALRDRGTSAPVIIITGHSSVQSAVEAMRQGAFHFLQKPVNLEEVRAHLRRALDRPSGAAGASNGRAEAASGRANASNGQAEASGKAVEAGGSTEPADPAREPAAERRPRPSSYPIDGILGSSDPIARVRETIRTIREVPNTTILILGETGTGKNLVAKTIHHNSLHRSGRFMEINCAALPDNLLEAELFGYEKGAFTDARASKPGLLEIADGGTLFLDEIDSMSMALQAKLLSFLESRMFRRLGGVDDISVSTRVLCATNANLEETVAQKQFRKDLFFRINVVNLRLPPLRVMSRDIISIAEAILAQFNRDLGREIEGLTTEAEQKLLEHPWPGNVRELRNVLERAVIFAKGTRLDVGDLVLTTAGGFEVPDDTGWMFLFPSGSTLEDLERAYILHTLQSTDASYAEISEMLGISKKTLWEKRKRYDLDEEVDR